MAKIKLTKSAVEAAQPEAQAVEQDHSKQRNKPGTQAGYQKCIKNNIIPMLGRMKV